MLSLASHIPLAEIAMGHDDRTKQRIVEVCEKTRLMHDYGVI